MVVEFWDELFGGAGLSSSGMFFTQLIICGYANCAIDEFVLQVDIVAMQMHVRTEIYNVGLYKS